jgi:hypothetical protein
MHTITTIKFDHDETALIECWAIPLAGLAEDWTGRGGDNPWSALRAVVSGNPCHREQFERALDATDAIRAAVIKQTTPDAWGSLPHADGLATMRQRELARLDDVIAILAAAAVLADPKATADD